MLTSDLMLKAARIACDAGALIMKHYEGEIIGRKKSDHSPVTDADEEAEHLILAALAKLAPGVPIVSEEAAAAGNTPTVDGVFFLVDPLDGTKEFLARNGEFTVNIALIENGRPTMGIVYAPAITRLFVGAEGKAFDCEWNHERASAELAASALRPIHARPVPDHPIAVWSRSHDTHKSDEYRKLYNVAAVKTVGSSVKFCVIAAGEADLYPRHGPTMEWDTAAGQGVLEAAGGSVLDLHGKPLLYGKAKDDFRNPSFVARGR